MQVSGNLKERQCNHKQTAMKLMDNDKQENHQEILTTLLDESLEEIFVFTNRSSAPNSKTRRHRKAKRVGKF